MVIVTSRTIELSTMTVLPSADFRLGTGAIVISLRKSRSARVATVEVFGTEAGENWSKLPDW